MDLFGCGRSDGWLIAFFVVVIVVIFGSIAAVFFHGKRLEAILELLVLFLRVITSAVSRSGRALAVTTDAALQDLQAVVQDQNEVRVALVPPRPRAGSRTSASR